MYKATLVYDAPNIKIYKYKEYMEDVVWRFIAVIPKESVVNPRKRLATVDIRGSEWAVYDSGMIIHDYNKETVDDVKKMANFIIGIETEESRQWQKKIKSKG